MEQARDFLDESDALHEIVSRLSPADLDRPTGFKGWTTNQIIRHLHAWNSAAKQSLLGSEIFQRFVVGILPHAAKGTMPVYEEEWLDNLTGQDLVAAWREEYRSVAEHFAKTDPKRRVAWAGPDMSARSSITARLMETWAHGQAIHDLLGVERTEHDRIRNIVMLGVNTYSWTFKNRGEEVPDPMPRLILTAPSGALWRFGEDSTTDSIEGPARDFCQVVTQTRNVADTDLTVRGQNATAWMARAQCFAGPAETPPPPGTRRKA